MADPIQWHPTYEELFKKAQDALHAPCHERWEQLRAAGHDTSGTTFHGPDAHKNQAQRVLDSIWPDMQGKILEYEHALEHVTDPHEGPVCEECQMLCQSALDGVNREMCVEMASDTSGEENE